MNRHVPHSNLCLLQMKHYTRIEETNRRVNAKWFCSFLYSVALRNLKLETEADYKSMNTEKMYARKPTHTIYADPVYCHDYL